MQGNCSRPFDETLDEGQKDVAMLMGAAAASSAFITPGFNAFPERTLAASDLLKPPEPVRELMSTTGVQVALPFHAAPRRCFSQSS